MAVDYDGVNGAMQNIDDALAEIEKLNQELGTGTLTSDVGELSTLYNNHLSKLKTNLENSKNNMTTKISEMKNIEECIINGREWGDKS